MAIFHPFPLLTLLSSLDRASTRRCGNVKEINRRIRLLETGLPYCLASGGRITYTSIMVLNVVYRCAWNRYMRIDDAGAVAVRCIFV